MADLLCPVCSHRFEEGVERCPQCGRPRPGVMPDYMKVPWERAATYIGSISAVMFVLWLLLAPRNATEPSPATNTPVPEAEKSAPSEGGASKEASNANSNSKDLVISSWNCVVNTSIDWVTIRGEVKNASGSSIKGLQLVGTLRTADGTFISSKDGFAEYDTILPGQTSPFEVLMPSNPAVRSADLSLKNQEDELVEFSGPHSETCTQSRADL
jgi:hypothetical protein